MDLYDWLLIMQGHIISAWEKRKNASKKSEQIYWNNVIYRLKEDVKYELWRRGYKQYVNMLSIEEILKNIKEDTE